MLLGSEIGQCCHFDLIDKMCAARQQIKLLSGADFSAASIHAPMYCNAKAGQDWGTHVPTISVPTIQFNPGRLFKFINCKHCRCCCYPRLAPSNKKDRSNFWWTDVVSILVGRPPEKSDTKKCWAEFLTRLGSTTGGGTHYAQSKQFRPAPSLKKKLFQVQEIPARHFLLKFSLVTAGQP